MPYASDNSAGYWYTESSPSYEESTWKHFFSLSVYTSNHWLGSGLHSTIGDYVKEFNFNYMFSLVDASNTAHVKNFGFTATYEGNACE